MTTTNWKKVLGPVQTAMLLRLAQNSELVPGGQRDSGRQASAWTRTAGALQKRGLAKLSYNGPGSGGVSITDFGRMVIAGSGSLSYTRAPK
jgi:hypothetical protein